ncbi:hypothetical protein [Mycolicibacter sinensis]|uniref:DUF3052 domain-containing protein n=1 Tax=Mycolicibacter sinensis (strain JDM601) TaxID=875328 RepID=A0A1A3U1X2_MYCSD|nr:hypothetical protein [Mycolicibacter sinensis]OBK88888.1 hypothetical protein A5648_21375 [Mycolicibacter sinensis]
MTTALYDDTTSAPGLAQLEQMLQIDRGSNVAVINAPPESGLRLLAISRANPYDVEVVIAFVTRRVDVAWIRAAYSAARSGRTAWVVYPEPGRPGTDLRWEWFLAALRQYGVQAVQQVPIDGSWSAVLLQRKRNGEPAPGLVG